MRVTLVVGIATLACVTAAPASNLVRLDPGLVAASDALAGVERTKKKGYKWKHGGCKYMLKVNKRGYKEKYKCK